jgi:hypothetical protein
MLAVGVINSDSADNKLYYQANQRYEYFLPLKAIFGDKTGSKQAASVIAGESNEDYAAAIRGIPKLRLALIAGMLVRGSASAIDVLLVGDLSPVKVKSAIKTIELGEGREISYSVLTYDEFYYRLSVRDRFITEILNGKYTVLVDQDNVLSQD